jgi:hypothetical protein
VTVCNSQIKVWRGKGVELILASKTLHCVDLATTKTTPHKIVKYLWHHKTSTNWLSGSQWCSKLLSHCSSGLTSCSYKGTSTLLALLWLVLQRLVVTVTGVYRQLYRHCSEPLEPMAPVVRDTWARVAETRGDCYWCVQTALPTL